MIPPGKTLCSFNCAISAVTAVSASALPVTTPNLNGNLLALKKKDILIFRTGEFDVKLTTH